VIWSTTQTQPNGASGERSARRATAVMNARLNEVFPLPTGAETTCKRACGFLSAPQKSVSAL